MRGWIPAPSVSVADALRLIQLLWGFRFGVVVVDVKAEVQASAFLFLYKVSYSTFFAETRCPNRVSREFHVAKSLLKPLDMTKTLMGTGIEWE